jgi:phytoene dehydrogenase-like protein
MSHFIFGREYPEQFDAIVIGAGIGGLFCSNFLARGGMKVLLVERHYALGGFCSGFRRKGFVFDAATHFYPLLGNSTTLTGKMLRDLNIPTEWVKMDPVDQYHFPGMPTFAVPADFDLYLERLCAWFPHERSAIDAYFAEIRQACLSGLLFYFRGIAHARAERFEGYTVAKKIDEHFSDVRLKAILMADSPHWGSLPTRTSYLFDAMLRMAYFLGNYYPRGSSQRFADDLGNAFQSRGGRVLKCCQVESILIEREAVQGVRIRALSRRSPRHYIFRAPVVVSNADAVHTYRDLIGEKHCGRGPIEHLESLMPTHPCFLLHLGLRGMDPEQLARAEGYYWSSFDPEDAVKNVFKIFVPTHFDAGLAPPGCQILIVQKLTPVRLEDVTDWNAHKAEVESQIMPRLREILPGIDQHIVTKSAASAFTSFRYTNNWQGAMLGWEMSPPQLGAGRLPSATPVKKLYLTGHWTCPGGGVTPVIISAHQVANAILTGKNDGTTEAEKKCAFEGFST